MSHTDYKQTLDYLFNKLPVYQHQGTPAANLDLSTTRELCWDLGMPQWKLNTVHVAGTNGKGSVSYMLASIFQEAGFRVGLFTSPHLGDFRERIRINGQPISEAEVVEWVDCYKLSIERLKPTFFELTTVMAFEYFADQEVDICLFEVGLGGRLDATNVLKPELSVVTGIGLDHTHILGETLAEIAGEKAGIFKKYTPAVIGRRHPETDPVFVKIADELEADLHFAADQYIATPVPGSDLYQTWEVNGQTYELDLMGRFQGENLATVLQSVEALRTDGWDIPEEAVLNGLRNVVRNTGMRGRMERLQSQPTVLCDVGHNLDGIRATIPQVKTLPYEQLHIIWGMVEEKDHQSILAELPSEATYYFTQPQNPRGLAAEKLASLASEVGLKGSVFADTQRALNAALEAAQPQDLIFVGGSTFTVADLLILWPERQAV